MEEKEKGRRGFLGRLLVFLLTLLALLGLVAMALSVINGFINPQNFIWTTIFGLAFWRAIECGSNGVHSTSCSSHWSQRSK